MGVTRIEKTGNQIVFTDVESGLQTQQPSKDLRYTMVNETIKFFRNGDIRIKPYKGFFVGLTGTVDLTGGSPTAATGTLTALTVLENTFATGTVTCVSAVANAFSTGTVTCVSAVANEFATGTVTAATAIEGNTVTVNGLVYTAVAGAPADNTEFSIDTGNNETATSLSAAINGDVRSGDSGDISATRVDAVVTIISDVAGTGGNAITLVSSGATLAVSGATFTGGVNVDTVTINGLLYTAVAGARANDTQFSIDTSDAATGIDLNAAITGDTRNGTTGDVSASDNGAGVVTLTTDVAGVAGNAITLTSNDGVTLAVSGATFSSGVDADNVTVNSLLYTAVAGARANDTEFSIDTSDAATGIDLKAAINGDGRTGTSGDVSASDNGAGVVTFTTDDAGTDGNSITLTSSDGGRLGVSGATFSGGVNEDFCTVNGLIYIAVAGAKANNTEFSTDTSNDATALDLAASITNDVRSGALNDVTATSAANVVTCTASVAGTVGNATLLTTSDGATLAVSGATFTGGIDASVDGIKINGIEIMSGVESFDISLNNTATNIANNIIAFTSIPNYTATSSGSLITIKIITPETAVDAFTVVSTVTVITSTDINMGVDTGNLEKSAGTLFISLAELVTFLRANTGA